MKVRIALTDRNKKIQAIKEVRAYTGLGLRESKAIVDAADAGYTGTLAPSASSVFDIPEGSYNDLQADLTGIAILSRVDTSLQTVTVAAARLAANAAADGASCASGAETLRGLFTGVVMPTVVAEALEILA